MGITGLNKFGVILGSNQSYALNWHTANTVINTLKQSTSQETRDQWFTDFASAVVSFRVYPFNLISHITYGSKKITFLGKETDILANGLTSYNNSYLIDMGSLNVANPPDSYLSYAPFSHYKIYLPFVGWYELDGALIIGKLISVKYLLDINTGNCIAYIMDGDTVLYRFNGVCGVNVPFSGSTRANVSKMDTVNTISFVGNAALSAYDLVSGIYKASNASTKTAASQGIAQAESGGKSLFSSGLNYVTNAISVPQVTSIRGGTSGDLSSFGEGFNCILVCEFCNPVISTGYSHIQGRPLMKVKKISELSGYTEVGTMHTDGITATASELDMIVSAMQEGVIL